MRTRSFGARGAVGAGPRIRAHIEEGPRGQHAEDHPTFHDGLRVQEVLDAAYASSETASIVEVAAS